MFHCSRQTGGEADFKPSDEKVTEHLLWGVFYVNPRDPRGWVPKTSGLGVTPNFRTRRAAIVFLVLVVLCAFSALGLGVMAIASAAD